MAVQLSKRIEELQQEMIPQIPDDVLETLQSTTEDLVASGIAEQALGKGDRIPKFQLTSATGVELDVQSLLEDGPLVLSFYRGGW